MRTQINGEESNQLRGIICGAFRQKRLEWAIRSIPLNLETFDGHGLTYEECVDNLITFVNKKHEIHVLVRALRAENSGNVPLRDFEEYLKTKQETPAPPSPQQHIDPVPTRPITTKLLWLKSKRPVSEKLSDVQKLIDRLKNGPRMEIVESSSGKWEDLFDLVHSNQFSIVHFSGHELQNDKLVIEREGALQPVDGEQLRSLLSLGSSSLRLVVFSGCYSAVVAEAISKIADCVVGTTASGGGNPTAEFAANLYFEIAIGRSIGGACRTAKLMLGGSTKEAESRFGCRVREGVDLSKVRILEPPSDFPEVCGGIDDRIVENAARCLLNATDAAKMLEVGLKLTMDGLPNAARCVRVVELLILRGVGMLAVCLEAWSECRRGNDSENAKKLEQVGHSLIPSILGKEDFQVLQKRFDDGRGGSVSIKIQRISVIETHIANAEQKRTKIERIETDRDELGNIIIDSRPSHALFKPAVEGIDPDGARFRIAFFISIVEALKRITDGIKEDALLDTVKNLLDMHYSTAERQFYYLYSLPADSLERQNTMELMLRLETELEGRVLIIGVEGTSNRAIEEQVAFFIERTWTRG